jgi:hypothetical protein
MDTFNLPLTIDVRYSKESTWELFEEKKKIYGSRTDMIQA